MTIEELEKLNQIMALAKAHFDGKYRIDLCQDDEDFWVSIADGFDRDYCSEQMTINEALEYMEGLNDYD